MPLVSLTSKPFFPSRENWVDQQLRGCISKSCDCFSLKHLFDLPLDLSELRDFFGLKLTYLQTRSLRSTHFVFRFLQKIAMKVLLFSVLVGASLAIIIPSTVKPTGLKLRPTVQPFPYTHGKARAVSPPRTKYCYVPAQGNNTDDSATIYQAFQACNNGGVVALLDPQYTIAKPLDLTFLNAVDFSIQGQISFTPDITFWTGKGSTFDYTYQDARLFWQIGGKDVNIYGGGTINGNGQIWWDRIVTNTTLQRPILLGIMGLKGGSMSNIKLINPPNWFQLVANSSDLIFDNLNQTAVSTSANLAKNSGKFLSKNRMRRKLKTNLKMAGICIGQMQS